MIRTRRTAPDWPAASPGERERLAWLVLDVGTGSVIGKITKISGIEPGAVEHWQAYGIVPADYGAKQNEPVRLGSHEQCRDAQNQIETWWNENQEVIT